MSLPLFDAPPVGERGRLNGQCRKILARLDQGPVSNKELSEMALKYTSRISDLRAAGHVVTCVSRDRKTGETWYRLGELV